MVPYLVRHRKFTQACSFLGPFEPLSVSPFAHLSSFSQPPSVISAGFQWQCHALHTALPDSRQMGPVCSFGPPSVERLLLFAFALFLLLG